MKTVVDIPFGGLDSKTYKALVPQGQQLSAVNCHTEKLGAVDPQPGLTLQSTTTDASGITDTPTVLTQDEVLGARIRTYALPSPNQTSVAYILCNSIDRDPTTGLLYITNQNYSLTTPRFSITTHDPSTHVSNTLVSSVTSHYAKATWSGDYHVVAYCDGTNVKCRFYNPSTGSVTTVTVGTSPAWALGYNGPYCDLIADGNHPDSVIVAYSDSSNYLQIKRVNRFGAALLFSGTAGGYAVRNNLDVLSSVDPDYVYVAYVGVTGNIRAAYFNHVTSTLGTVATVNTTTGFFGSLSLYELAAGNLLVLARYQPALGNSIQYTMAFSTTFSASTEYAYVGRNIIPTSHPFVYKGDLYFWANGSVALNYLGNTKSQNQVELLVKIDITATTNRTFFQAVGAAEEGNANKNCIYSTSVYHSCNKVTQNYYTTLVTTPQNAIESGGLSGVSLVQIEDSPVRTKRVGNSTLFTGPTLFESDSEKITESGFLFSPELTLITNTTGGSFAAGTHYFAAVYVDMDANGVQHWSAPSLVYPVTTAASGLVVIRATSYGCGRRSPALLLYVGDSSGLLYRQQRVEPAVLEAANYVDLTVAGNPIGTPLLYTDSGVVENSLTGNCVIDLVNHNEQIFALQPTGRVLYSKDFVQGTGIELAQDYLYHDLPVGSEGYGQLASMDGRLYAFMPNAIYVCQGKGADSQGNNSSLTPWDKVQGSIGIVQDSCVVDSPLGLIFQKKSGDICLLDRSVSLSTQLADQVNDIIRGMTLKAGKYCEARNEIWLGFGSATAETTLVYNTITGGWATYSSGYDLFKGSTFGDIVTDANNNVYCFRQADGKLYLLSWNTPNYDMYAPSGQAVTIETPWLRVGSLGEVQRIHSWQISGEYQSDATLSVSHYFDGSETVAATNTISFKASDGYAATSPVVINRHVGNRCSSVKIKIQMSVPNGSSVGKMIRIYGLSLELQKRPSMLKLSTSGGR